MTDTAPNPTVASLRDRLDPLMERDRHRLRRRLDKLRRTRDRAGRQRALADIAAAVAEAEERVRRRRAAVPEPSYPTDLPITARRDDLLDAIGAHQVVVVAGETGSGKSTQLPKLCLELGRGVRGMIGHTQPRRLAARSVAERVADELGSEVGATVGYQVRFTDRVGDGTLVKVMTDGILLAEVQRDPLLRAYDTIIIDEAHERSLNIDFLLGYLRRLLPRRPDLKLVITSATIDTERFAAHFDAPVVSVSGRTYPVEVRYRPFGQDPDDDRDQTQAVCDAVVELSRDVPGDVLVFLSGEREIHDTADAVRALDLQDTEVVPLYARLPAAEQHRIFGPHQGRRVVLATNVAETSLTVPGIRSVVDAGTARISRYSRRLKVQRLPIEPVSRASADQRAGRCGRVAPGVCIRLYDEDDLDARPEFTEPEILRTNLASVILRMADIGLGEVADFPFVDPPDPRSVTDGIRLLEELGAFDPAATDPRRRLTPLGRRLARLPLDPRLGRMVLEAEREGCGREVIVIATALSIQDPRERPREQREAADEMHARFGGDGSDFVALLRLWDHLRTEQRQRSGNQFRRMCRAEHLNYLRVREWQDLERQLRRVCRDLGISVTSAPDDHDGIHRAVLSGLLAQIGMRDRDSREYRGPRQVRFTIAPGSTLGRRGPRWVMAAELVETNRLWARTVAGIRPEWAEALADHLVTRSYGEPWWDRDRGAAMTTERVTLYGLPIVVNRRLPWGRVDPAGARAAFIANALVADDWDGRVRVVDENRAVVAEVRELADRARRGQHLVPDGALFRFYDERIGADVTSAGHFHRWWKRARAGHGDLLTLTPEILLAEAEPVDTDAFPDTWTQGDLELTVGYVFDPGSPDDGVRVHVPLAVLNRVRVEGFDWQVPGLREELVTALLRGLPKPLRRPLVPIPDRVREILGRVGPGDGPLLDVLADEVARLTGVRPGRDDWAIDQLDPHLRVGFVITDDDGEPVATGTDLDRLRAGLVEPLRAELADAATGIEVAGLTGWTIGSLPRRVEVDRVGHTVVGWPALVDEGRSVAVRVLEDADAQARAMRAGTRRLLLMGLGPARRRLARALSQRTQLALARGGAGRLTELLDDAVAAAVDTLVDRHGGPAWDEDGFEALRAAVGDDVVETATGLVEVVAEILTAADDAVEVAAALTSPALWPSVEDVRAQLDRLLLPGFVVEVGAERLADHRRYVRAAAHRLHKLADDPARDRERMAVVHRLEERLGEIGPQRWADRREAVEAVARSIQELRVSLFAQHLGTAGKISQQRVERALDALAQ